MEHFIPADWRINTGDAFEPSRGEDDGHVVMHNQPLWFDDPLEMDLFSAIFGGMRAAADTADYSTPPPEAIGATPYHGDSTTVASSSTLPGAPDGGKRKKRDTTVSPSEVLQVQDAEESDSSAADQVTTTRRPAQSQRPTTGKRRRAAQEHNLSERRRRDRINEKMRALQELVPHCNKTDKATMLDEAIEYLKSLQLQLQMMSTTGGRTAPSPAMMFTASGATRYMQRMGSMRSSSRMAPFRNGVCTSSDKCLCFRPIR